MLSQQSHPSFNMNTSNTSNTAGSGLGMFEYFNLENMSGAHPQTACDVASVGASALNDISYHINGNASMYASPSQTQLAASSQPSTNSPTWRYNLPNSVSSNINGLFQSPTSEQFGGGQTSGGLIMQPFLIHTSPTSAFQTGTYKVINLLFC